ALKPIAYVRVGPVRGPVFPPLEQDDSARAAARSAIGTRIRRIFNAWRSGVQFRRPHRPMRRAHVAHGTRHRGTRVAPVSTRRLGIPAKPSVDLARRNVHAPYRPQTFTFQPPRIDIGGIDPTIRIPRLATCAVGKTVVTTDSISGHATRRVRVAS